MNKKIIISIFLFAPIFFTGCNKTNISMLQKESAKEISTVQSIISKSYVPSIDSLSIPAFEYEFSTQVNDENNVNNSFTSWNVVFSKPLTQDIVTSISQPEFPFQYTNIIATYTPRYTYSNSSEITGFNKFINKLENLYLQMQDSLVASYEIKEIQKNFNFQLSLIKEKINTMQNKKEEITSSQLKNAQEILDELVSVSNNLKKIDNQIKVLSEEIKTEKNNLILNTDALSNKYIKIINLLDNKLSNLNNIQQCLNQLDLIILNSKKIENQSSNHYIDYEHLKPVSRETYSKKFKDFFKNELSLKPSKKVPLPYIIDSGNQNNKTNYM